MRCGSGTSGLGGGGRPDRGIDLVARERESQELWAVQCKFYDPQHQISKPDVDSFLAESGTGEFTKRLFVSTTDRWNSAAERTVTHQAIPVQRLGLDDLFSASIDWDSFELSTPEVMQRKGRKTLRAHQERALAAVREGLASADRGKLIMACGTGKTFTSLAIAEELTGEGGRVLFLVPSIALLSQTLREWSADSSIPVRSFAVCSDSTVGRQAEDASTIDLAIPATTNPERLANVLSKRVAPIDGKTPMTVVFSTYQSLAVVAEAQQLGAPEFDLVICDEAHRTTGAKLAGEEDSAFVRVHDAAYLAARKRLYMTATPRIYGTETKKKAEDKGAVIASMDDSALYGEELFRLGFGEAVSQNLLTDYKVLVLTVSESKVAREFAEQLAQDGDLNIGDAARIMGCWNALAKYSIDPEDFSQDPEPMKTAVAFAANIAASKRFARACDSLSQELSARSGHHEGPSIPVLAKHVDGQMNMMQRENLLAWLAGGANDEADAAEMQGGVEGAEDPAQACRILSNARCLSEGVDVPALDAVMFLAPRKSQVDIVQSVGRVMRLAPGKKFGYIILPVAVPVGMSPEEALNQSKAFDVVWQVLQALRAHDERFDAMVNKIDLNTHKPDRVRIVDVTPGGGAGEDDGNGQPTAQQLAFNLTELTELREAIYARLVAKVGTRRYWEQWAADVATIAARHHERLRARLEVPEVAREFSRFVDALRANLNESITEDAALDMLSQHLVSKPVFDAVFEGRDFTQTNPVARVMAQMLEVLDDAQLESETRDLDGFYVSVRERCAGIDNAAGKQRVITELYENFFSLAFKKTSEALGIVYTPIEVVDFILRGVDALLHRHFGVGVTQEGVHVLDPFTGTGTFIVRLLQSGLITPEDLLRKYTEELHANEILLLAYYIAVANIEVAYAEVSGRELEPFPGIILTDTFQMHEDDDALDQQIFTDNNDRALAQMSLDIQVIVGNPPYSAGQKSANDDNANVKYPTLDRRIEETYVARSDVQNKNALYDSYVRAIRWASDRIGKKGIIGFVTNGGFLDGNAAAGLRLCLGEEFTQLYVVNLRGNQRTAGELSRREGGKIFDSGSRATVAITFLLKDPAHRGPSEIFYHDIGDYLSRADKLRILEQSSVDSLPWTSVLPDEHGDWLSQRDPRFVSWQSLGGKDEPGGIFALRSNGLKTQRDAWVYGSSMTQLQSRMSDMLAYYNTYAERRELPKQLDSTRFAWTRAARNDAARGKSYRLGADRYYTAMYRPFFKQHLVFDRQINEMVYRIPQTFPTPGHDNIGIVVSGLSANSPFSCFVVDEVLDLQLLSNGQFFPRWTWEPITGRHAADSGSVQGFDLEALSGAPVATAGAPAPSDSHARSPYQGEVLGNYRRVDNITDASLTRYRAAYGPEVTKDDIFYYVYGLLHSPQYRQAYAADLKKMLPHIPLVQTREDFVAFSTAGRGLADLHLDYESCDAMPVGLVVDGDNIPWERRRDIDPPLLLVTKMRYGGSQGKWDKTTLRYNAHVTLTGLPLEAQDYVIGSRSALDWLIDRYQVSTDKKSGIVNDVNDWMLEGADGGPDVGPQPYYLLELIARVTALSVRTQEIVEALPPLNLRE